jgi:hypothetical protein
MTHRSTRSHTSANMSFQSPANNNMSHTEQSTPVTVRIKSPGIAKPISTKASPTKHPRNDEEKEKENPDDTNTMHSLDTNATSAEKFELLFDHITKLSTTMTTLNEGLQQEFKKATTAHTDDMTRLEHKLLESQDAKYAGLSTTMQTQHEAQSTRITILETENDRLTKQVKENSDKLLSQSFLTAKLEQQMEEMRVRVDINIQNFEEFELTNASDIDQIKKSALTALKLANSVEQHGRRWAVRFLGIAAPGPDGESKLQAKEKALKVIKENLKIERVQITDIDCAHRVGYVTATNKQTMLVRFFARDLADDVRSRMKHLKGTGMILYKDATSLNRSLLNRIKDRDDVASVWMQNGKIWARPVANGPKFKIELGDNYEEKMHLQPLEDQDDTNDPEIPNQISPTHTQETVTEPNGNPA